MKYKDFFILTEMAGEKFDNTTGESFTVGMRVRKTAGKNIHGVAIIKALYMNVREALIEYWDGSVEKVALDDIKPETGLNESDSDGPIVIDPTNDNGELDNLSVQPCEDIDLSKFGKVVPDYDAGKEVSAHNLYGDKASDKEIYEDNLIIAKDLLNKIDLLKDQRGLKTKLIKMGITGSKISSIISGLNYSGKGSYSTPEGKKTAKALLLLLKKIFLRGVNVWSDKGQLNEGMGNLKGLAAAGLMGMSQIITPGSVFASHSKPPVSVSAESHVNYKDNIVNIIKSFENNKGYKPGGWNPVKMLWFPYDDHGKPAIGYGHDFDIIKLDQFENGISDQKADQILQDDIKQKQSDARKIIPQFDNLPVNIQNAIIVGMFRGDIGKHASPKTLSYINQGKWKDAANELRDSKDYRKGGGIQKRIESIAKEFEKNVS